MHPFKRIRLGLKPIFYYIFCSLFVDCPRSPNLMAVLLLMVSEKTLRDFLSVTMWMSHRKKCHSGKNPHQLSNTLASIEAP